ncbi:MAG: ABC transporter substrate-binding protein, partial [Acidimicrobiia bacterium]
MRTRSSRLVLAFLLVVVSAACSSRDAADGEQGDTTQEGRPEGGAAQAKPVALTVLLPNPSAINVLNLCPAEGEGYFEPANLEVRVESVDGSGSGLQAMAANRAQVGLPGPGPLLNARARSEDMVMFYNHFAQSVFGLVVPEDSKYQTPAALKGATIGVGTAEGRKSPSPGQSWPRPGSRRAVTTSFSRSGGGG